ncbi:hypothetical protein NL676_019222 [Syzygium grande]|nr:hypothetical protein NL676_019222 [Syzygium grande]
MRCFELLLLPPILSSVTAHVVGWSRMLPPLPATPAGPVAETPLGRDRQGRDPAMSLELPFARSPRESRCYQSLLPPLTTYLTQARPAAAEAGLFARKLWVEPRCRHHRVYLTATTANMEGPFGAKCPAKEKVKRGEMVASESRCIFVHDIANAAIDGMPSVVEGKKGGY